MLRCLSFGSSVEAGLCTGDMIKLFLRQIEPNGGNPMKRIAILIMLISITGLTACANSSTPPKNASSQNTTTIVMELDENYDDTDPFVNEKLFCVSEDLDSLTATGTLDMDGGNGSLEVKNNKTNEVLWSETWETSVEEEAFSISLENLKKDDEYVICFTGTEINHATVEVAFNSDVVQERERPLQ